MQDQTEPPEETARRIVTITDTAQAAILAATAETDDLGRVASAAIALADTFGEIHETAPFRADPDDLTLRTLALDLEYRALTPAGYDLSHLAVLYAAHQRHDESRALRAAHHATKSLLFTARAVHEGQGPCQIDGIAYDFLEAAEIEATRAATAIADANLAKLNQMAPREATERALRAS